MNTLTNIENRDRAGTAHGDVEPGKIAVVHHDVGNTWQGQSRFHHAGVAIDHHERSGVGRAPERGAPLPRHDGKAVRACRRDGNRAGHRKDISFDDTDRRGLRDVHVNRAARVIANGPARPAGEVDRRRDPALFDRDHRDRAVGPRGLAKVEAKESPEPSVVRERVRPRTNRNPIDERLVRTAKEAHPSGRAIGREEQVLLAVDQHTGDAWQIRDRADVRSAATVQHVDPIGASVGDVESTATRVKVRVGVIEARFGSWRHGREAHVPQGHAAFASTFF